MKTDAKFTVVFEEGSFVSNLSFDEADKAMEESETTGNVWTNVYVNSTNENN